MKFTSNWVLNYALTATSASLLGCFASTSALAQSINFTEVSADPSMGLTYQRAPSAGLGATLGLQQASLNGGVPMEAFGAVPHRTMGLPGVVLVDHDNDGDTDIYVTNGPGAPNSLFSNQLSESGQFTFVDVGATSGADATSQDSNGSCFGDVDNDGDEDLLVLGRGEANLLHLNDGSGNFTVHTASGLDGGTFSHIGCSMGDIDGDGLLDVVIGNSFDMSTQLPLVAFPYSNEPNQLFLNLGGATFADVSATSGILNMDGLTNAPPDATTITWTVAMIDIDQDGDMDVVHGDDQGPVPEAAAGGFDRAFMHVFLNDGTGHFTDEVVNLNPDSVASWMGVDFADLNHDGNIDFFGGNFGDYMGSAFGIPYEFHHFATRPHFGNGDGTFTDPSSVAATAFSWGTAVADLDNDGDHDATYHGGLDMVFVKLSDNPGVVMVNDGDGNFVAETGGYTGDYTRRSVQGVASGDLDQDGFIDIVTASDHQLPDTAPQLLSGDQYGSPLDSTAFFTPLFQPDGQGNFVWSGVSLEPGVMTVEMNDGDSGFKSIRVSAQGSAGITSRGRHNRSGIGAIVSFTPRWGGDTMTQPITGGSSFLSQHEAVAHFGVGHGRRGTVDVLWNGGHRNRLYGVRAGSTIDYPEIGCSYDSPEPLYSYLYCLSDELGDLYTAGEVSYFGYYKHYFSMFFAKLNP